MSLSVFDKVYKATWDYIQRYNHSSQPQFWYRYNHPIGDDDKKKVSDALWEDHNVSTKWINDTDVFIDVSLIHPEERSEGWQSKKTRRKR